MIRNMRTYTYTQPSTTKDAYGQYPQETGGTILMWISNRNNTPVTNNPLFNEADYIGITQSTLPDGARVTYGTDTLQVLYSITGRFNQVYMKRC